MFASKDLFLTAPSGYQISRSVRFRQSASAYFNRTPASSGSQTTYTYSAWVKKGLLASANYLVLWSSESSGANYTSLVYYADAFYWATNATVLTSTAVYRDTSAWYHIVLAVDTTQATSTNRVKIYVNGTQVTLSGSYPTLNQALQINTSAYTGKIGFGSGFSQYFDGYMAEFNFIDGQALTPSSFGQTNPVTGVWQPIKYAGTYGTNGFYLNFSDNSNNTATTIGKDYSGNGNNWTPNNISVTAGATYDSMLDVPTPYADGGNGRGNYCVLNTLNKGTNQTVANGNLTSTASAHGTVLTTIGVASGKWYGESVLTVSGTGGIGATINQAAESAYSQSAGKWWVYDNGSSFNIVNGATIPASGGSRFSAGQIWQWAIDVDNGKIWIGVNNAWIDSANGTTGNPATGANPTFTFTAGTLIWPFLENGAGPTWDANFGQRPFTYTPPTGFVALNTQNLPTPTISNGATVMAATTYTGNASARTVANTVNGVSFQPDFVWIKMRSAGSAVNHHLVDYVRGDGKVLYSNLTNAEDNLGSTTIYMASTGFGLSAGVGVNENSQTFVGWQWKASNSAGSSNTSGSITSTVSVNATAGFSIVTWAGSGAAGTIGHGLNAVPAMLITKNRSTGTNANWVVWQKNLTGGNTVTDAYYMYLNGTNGQNASGGVFYKGTDITSTTFGFQSGNSNVNASGNNYVAYCWSEVAGFSKFGSYTGNGSTDGTFVYLGFRARFLMIKCSSSTGGWVMLDTSRDPYNIVGNYLYANSSAADAGSSNVLDINSNGFKIRNTWTDINGSGTTYIYAAFAENPFKNSLAR